MSVPVDWSATPEAMINSVPTPAAIAGSLMPSKTILFWFALTVGKQGSWFHGLCSLILVLSLIFKLMIWVRDDDVLRSA